MVKALGMVAKRIADWLEKFSVLGSRYRRVSRQHIGIVCLNYRACNISLDNKKAGRQMTTTWMLALLMVFAVGGLGLYLTRKPN